MSTADAAALSLKNGDPAAALAHLQEQVRDKPSDAKLRIFLFQLLCVLGEWERALNQLKVACELDASALAMAQMYGDAVRCEAIRRDVFEGKKAPMVFGEPDQWLALLIESLLVGGRGDASRAADLRARAFEDAATSSGEINGQPFEWIADADSRLGPVLEAVINGRYYWVPFSRLAEVTIEAPEDLRDMVWMPAHLQFANGGDMVALIPDALCRVGTIVGRPDRAGSQDRVGGSGAGRPSRPRPARPRHRRGGRPAAGSSVAGRSRGRHRSGSRRRLTMAEQLTPQERLQPALARPAHRRRAGRRRRSRASIGCMSKSSDAAGGAARPRVAVQRHEDSRARIGHGDRCRTRAAR